ncbi:MAG: hypothetical protein ACO1QB_13345 [Verrucomicrobiales bacterium]
MPASPRAETARTPWVDVAGVDESFAIGSPLVAVERQVLSFGHSMRSPDHNRSSSELPEALQSS